MRPIKPLHRMDFQVYKTRAALSRERFSRLVLAREAQRPRSPAVEIPLPAPKTIEVKAPPEIKTPVAVNVPPVRPSTATGSSRHNSEGESVTPAPSPAASPLIVELTAAIADRQVCFSDQSPPSDSQRLRERKRTASEAAKRRSITIGQAAGSEPYPSLTADTELPATSTFEEVATPKIEPVMSKIEQTFHEDFEMVLSFFGVMSDSFSKWGIVNKEDCFVHSADEYGLLRHHRACVAASSADAAARLKKILGKK